MEKKMLTMLVSFFVGVTAIPTTTFASDVAEVKQRNEVMETNIETEHELETIWDASKDSYSYCFKENYHFGDYQLEEDYLTDEFISQYTISELDVTHAETVGNQPIAVETWQEHAAESFSGGDGTTENPYQINSAEELALLAKKVNAFDTK